MDDNFQSRKAVYQQCKRHGTFSVVDTKKKLQDFDESAMNLYEGKYTMVAEKVESKCLIKKFSNDDTKLRFYSQMRNIHHHSILSVQNFYDESGQPRFVFSWADGSIEAWFKVGKAKRMVKSTLRGSCPSPKFREHIIDICSGLEYLFKKNIYPIKICAEGILMCQVGNQYFPKLLICEAKAPETINIGNHKQQLWAQVKQTVKSLLNDYGNHQNLIDPVSLRFLDYIGRSSVSDLENFPDNWTQLQKAKYLLGLMSLDRNDASAKVANVGISWPRCPSGNLQSPLREMVAYDNTRANPSNYNVQDAYDFLRACKDVIKHWRILPFSVKDVCTSWKAMVDRMDVWNPEIWCILYEIFGSKSSI